MNRLSRDEIIHAALDACDSPALDEHDRPAGIIVEGAHGIGWLQRGLDLAHRLWEFAGTLKIQTFAFLTGVDRYTLAEDFNRDIRDGLLVTGAAPPINQRAYRASQEDLLSFRVQQTPDPPQPRVPYAYIITPPDMTVFPVPDRNYTGSLHYYALPSILVDGAYIPQFPDDHVLVKYVFLEAREWTKEIGPGSAEGYLKQAVGALQIAGHGREASRPDIPLDRRVFRRPWTEGFGDWMGRTTVYGTPPPGL
jgi:hypothetical protein